MFGPLAGRKSIVGRSKPLTNVTSVVNNSTLKEGGPLISKIKRSRIVPSTKEISAFPEFLKLSTKEPPKFGPPMFTSKLFGGKVYRLPVHSPKRKSLSLLLVIVIPPTLGS